MKQCHTLGTFISEKHILFRRNLLYCDGAIGVEAFIGLFKIYTPFPTSKQNANHEQAIKVYTA